MVVPNEEPNKPKKSRARSLPVPVPASSALLHVINPDAAGIDVHSDMHMVCVPAGRAVGGQDNDAVGPVLPPDPQSDRWTGNSQGDRAQVGMFGLQDACSSTAKEYVTQSMEEYEAQMKAKMLDTLKRKAAAMGFQLSPLPTE